MKKRLRQGFIAIVVFFSAGFFGAVSFPGKAEAMSSSECGALQGTTVGSSENCPVGKPNVAGNVTSLVGITVGKCCVPASTASGETAPTFADEAACTTAGGMPKRAACDPGDTRLGKIMAAGAARTECCRVPAPGTTSSSTAGTPTAGACSGGTCRSACQSGEAPSGACSVAGVSGGTCCKLAAAPSAPQTINFTNPLLFNTVDEVLTSILGTLRGIIVVLSLVFIVIGAVMYILSAGNDSMMKTAKGAITASMIGLAIGIAAPSFLKEIGSILGWGDVNSSAAASALTLSQIARNVLNFLLSIVGILAIIMLLIGGIMYLTAAGDEDRIDTGKKIVKWSIIGILTALASMVIVSQIAALLV